MDPFIAHDSAIGLFELACYLSTVFAALASYLLGARI